MKSLLITLVLLSLASCGQKKKSSKVNQIFVKGNPLALIAGSDQNRQSFIDLSNLSDFKDYHLSGITIFTEKEFITNEQSENIEEGNEAESEDQTTSAPSNYNFSPLSANQWVYRDHNDKLSLGFKQVGNQVNLNTFNLVGTNYKVNVQHYSISSDKSKMSFLMTLKTSEDGTVLLVMVFSKSKPIRRALTKVDSRNFYLLGPGVKVPLKLEKDDQLTIKLCGNLEHHINPLVVQEAIKTWEEPIRKVRPKFTIKTVTQDTCKPFSDVDERSITYVEKYLTLAGKDVSNPGLAMIRTDFSELEHFDADIFLLGAEINKHQQLYNSIGATITHEVGHLLGLDHQFSGVPSIMSYDDIHHLKRYDEEAIAALYAL